MVGSSPSSESEPKAVTKSAMSLSPLSLALLLLSKFIAHGDDGDDGRMRDTRIAAGAAQARQWSEKALMSKKTWEVELEKVKQTCIELAMVNSPAREGR